MENTIAKEYLHAVILPLHAHACSTKTFRNILSIIEHLSHVPPNSRGVFLERLSSAADALCTQATQDIHKLLHALPAQPASSSSLSADASFGGATVGGASADATVGGAPASAAGGVNEGGTGGGNGGGNESATVEEVVVQKVTLALFSPSDSAQAKLLRVLKTIDYLCSKNTTIHSSSTMDSSVGTPMTSVRQWPDNDILHHFHRPDYVHLWRQVQLCLQRVQAHFHALGFVATVLLPLIECFMIASKYALAKPTPTPTITGTTGTVTTGTVTGTTTTPTTTTTPMTELFYAFTDKNRKILNTLVKNNPKLLRGSFSLLIQNPRVLEFDSKRLYFNQQLHKKPPNHSSSSHNNTINISVRRQYIFQDSYYQLQNKTGPALRYAKLSVRFADEEGADSGGVTREWYEELTKEMFNPNYALWQPSAEKTGLTYQPNATSWVNPSHLLYFRFVGRVIGKAIYDGRLLDCYFTRSVYKHILDKPVDVSDMEAVDPEYHKSLVWILENPIHDVLDLTFSTEMEEFGQQKVIDLVPNGRNVPVTDDNKHEYVKLIVENKLTTAVKEQLKAFLDGFHDMIPLELVQIFTEKELELLISGVPDIDIDDWKNNTEYRGYSATSPQVQWFWRALRSFDQEQRAKLLQFATGTSKVPLEGFSQLQGAGGKQRFQIHRDFGGVERLPSAHTCFNQVDLPEYDTYEQLRERLIKSITEGAVGFGFE